MSDTTETMYPCADCGKLRTKAEGGTTFTVCDACWDRRHPPRVAPTLSDEERAEAVRRANILLPFGGSDPANIVLRYEATVDAATVRITELESLLAEQDAQLSQLRDTEWEFAATLKLIAGQPGIDATSKRVLAELASRLPASDGERTP